MERYDFRTKRLFVEVPLAAGRQVEASPGQSNYLFNVLRLKAGDHVLLFNGADGEWRAELAPAGRRGCRLTVTDQTRPQSPASDLWYLFAPLRQARLDYMAQKAVEMGAGALLPVITAHTQVGRLNMARMRANAIEAAEQCGVLSLPEIGEPRPLNQVLAGWPAGRHLVFCDETPDAADPLAALKPLRGWPLAVLVGPEGGFSADERDRLRALPFVTPVALGPRILRADTAAVAALALVQALAGDWRAAPARVPDS
ncbi:MAG: ribosomal RNA small subunit methyltransferase E [Alphaproteobacteria bacterium]|nr:MAG: ribosomal RNA small subunit methyltransferase E [Alphaproteobacteria bacterium]